MTRTTAGKATLAARGWALIACLAAAATPVAVHGFAVESMWETRTGQGPEFVYLLSWPDEASMRSAWRAFLADEEWIRIKQESAREHGAMVGDIEDRVLRRTGYSPSGAANEAPAQPSIP